MISACFVFILRALQDRMDLKVPREAGYVMRPLWCLSSLLFPSLKGRLENSYKLDCWEDRINDQASAKDFNEKYSGSACSRMTGWRPICMLAWMLNVPVLHICMLAWPFSEACMHACLQQLLFSVPCMYSVWHPDQRVLFNISGRLQDECALTRSSLCTYGFTIGVGYDIQPSLHVKGCFIVCRETECTDLQGFQGFQGVPGEAGPTVSSCDI